MVTRRVLKPVNESFILNAVIEEHNCLFRLNLSVEARPDPPDAILSDGATTTWLELTNTFYPEGWAQDLTSYAATDKAHQPMEHGLFTNMDAMFAICFCDLVLKKASKPSYAPFVQRYGPGILMVGLESPWLNPNTLDAMCAEWAKRGSPDISTTFAHVYIGYRSNGANYATRWDYSNLSNSRGLKTKSAAI